MTDQLKQFHAWLQSALPGISKTILDDLLTGHQYLPKTYAGLPTNMMELEAALTALAEGGLVRQDGAGVYFWLNEPVKVEPQMELFA